MLIPKLACVTLGKAWSEEKPNTQNIRTVCILKLREHLTKLTGVDL